ncbi:MAG TPA: GGDEF domain-containing protein [Xanthobacteraceae bacterium]|nr:GGDEF domain-containing protein [Xanthobacteraceae bacterium]
MVADCLTPVRISAMALQGPFAVIADSPAPDVVAALRAAGGFPVIEASWSDAPAALAAVEPEALILAEPCAERARVAALADMLAARRGGLYTPVLARSRDDGAPFMAAALAIAASAPAERLIRRLATALRLRTLHGTVLRRLRTLASRGEELPALATSDPLDEATVLVAGRGRSYPALSVAVGERVAVIGALSVESAARALNARDIDGVVIGEGFGPRLVEALLTVLAEDVRFRDLPVAVLGGPPLLIEPFAVELANLERTAEGPERLVERLLPYVRAHAFGQRLKRMLKSLDARGMIDPDSGLLAHDAFWRDLNRAVGDAEKRGVGLSIARFAFEGGDRRLSLDAARLVGRLMRDVDFACREADNSIFAVFTETDLRAAHVVARRIASVLKHTMLAPDRRRSGIEAAVTLATLKATDNVDSLIARVIGAPG